MSETPDRRPILASDAERDGAVVRLRDAVAEGRLTLEEFSGRVERAQTARTDAELAELTTDLPAAAAVTDRPATRAPAEPLEHRAAFSMLARNGPWTLPVRSAWRSIFGTIELDLREARLESDDSELSVYNLFGTVTVLVPAGIEVDVRGGGLFASQRVEMPDTPPVPGAPRLTITCRGPGGTLHVRTRPRLKQALREAITGA